MKNTFLKSGLLFLTILFLNAGRLSAQTCMYDITNSTGCTIDVTVEFYGGGGVCDSQNSQVATGSGWHIFCNGTCSPSSIANVKVILNSIGGQSATGAYVDKNSQNYSGVTPSPSCLGGTGYNITWGGPATDFTN